MTNEGSINALLNSQMITVSSKKILISSIKMGTELVSAVNVHSRLFLHQQLRHSNESLRLVQNERYNHRSIRSFGIEKKGCADCDVQVSMSTTHRDRIWLKLQRMMSYDSDTAHHKL